ncbi:MAG: hypothetical protein KJZ80_10610 [Hyphomicrobiaceae bacterium]|nr:hypothetical protein [Hyphomicrobiaceae bacterium]
MAQATGTTPPQLQTNQAYLEQAMRPPALAIDDPDAVFAFVLAALPERVKVYPTENYYYFGFMHGHIRYAGNIRLDVNERDKGRLHFAYFEDLAEWKGEEQVRHVVLDASHGVRLEKLSPLVYRVTHEGVSVVFELNDLTGVKPPPGLLAPDERLIGPMFDESGLSFFLAFNRRLKAFHYILDETRGVAEQFTPSHPDGRILIGKRTGFAFYRDHKIDRKILIGVFEGNARVNNYFDGPFDQLPDNFIEGESLRSAILEAEPQLAGRIDRLGISPGGADRYMIAPYRHYRTEEDLIIFDECARSKAIPAEHYHGCFVFIEEEPQTAGVPPPPLKRPARAAKSRRPARQQAGTQ